MGFEDPKPPNGKLTRNQHRILMSKLVERPGPLETPCLIWTGAKRGEYGMFLHKRVHKVFWEHYNGPVPKGKVLAHECNVKLCVRHVRPKTQAENMQEYSGKELATHCPNNHELTPDNVYTPPGRPYDRRCKTCRREKARPEVSGSYMGPTITIRRAGRGLVVSVMPAEARRYELWSQDGEGNRYLEAAMDVPEDGQRDPRDDNA